ncbi:MULTISPECIES: 5'-deoxynucleotidase [Eubacterium]|uniref:5'-deoxynucleotidase n=1 Tax=Eubacterium ruminantium TaxID=42322 RepID=A0A1T4NCQ3_9FIRM|nr:MULTISPECIES: 5'-deoxynucleotidase [Eubacterium]MCR5367766.1 5'-deoxynucleotidase [Eubacterium sp.]SCW52955.1 5'-deoxynucleotidase [Eubacterium ruminantium]SDM85297.1 5'-deoxynucleotidase [Eubacterium ruminantium]SJZ76915.1 5'-deoxynucleotidase [Eubacterium ruminantium]
MNHNFFATISRMKYIERWALMRNSRAENLSEHSLDVAMISHALCVIGNVRYNKNLNGEKAALIGLYHDSSEIITGDMPTPVKYYNEDIKAAYKEVESIAEKKLLNELPSDLRPEFEKIYKSDRSEEEKYMRHLVKAADKLSAYIKCIEEENSGNREFRSAKESIEKKLIEMSEEYPEVKDFMEEFIPPYGKTLDELSAR